MNSRKIILVVCLLGSSLLGKAQLMNAYKHNAEIGVGLGLGHYFGDLNPSAKINRPKAGFGLFFRKQLNDYIGLRLSGEYAFLGYSDRYSDNPVQQRRNLSFNSSVWELGLSGDFNFFRFQPGFEGFNFTPYAGIGFGIFTYEPYAFLNGVKYQLRDLGTEGQGSATYPDLQPYTPLAFAIPFTLGVKYAITPKMNVFGELVYRFTNTDYLDDVSGNYAPDAFPPLPDGSPSPAYLLQDRSYETGSPIGIKGRQRGTSLKKDAFLTLKVGVSFNLQTYRCPTY